MYSRPPFTHDVTKSIIFQIVSVESRYDTTQVFGVDNEGHSCMAHVTGFKPYLYIERKDHDIPALVNQINEFIKQSAKTKWTPRIERVEEVNNVRSIMGDNPCTEFIKFTFSTQSCMYGLNKWFADRGILTYDNNLKPEMRVMVETGMKGCGWIELKPGTYEYVMDQKTTVQCEITCHYKNIIAHEPVGEYLKSAPWRILSFDIECAGRKGIFPVPDTDPTIQICCAVSSLLSVDKPFIKIAFVLKGCLPIEGVTIVECLSVEELLMNFTRFCHEVDPDVFTGYNIIGFDFEFLMLQACTLQQGEFPFFTRIKGMVSRLKEEKFESAAFGARVDKVVTVNGRVLFDVLSVVRREYKLRSYTLNSVSAQFLRQQKEDVDFRQITPMHMQGDETRRRLAVYCMKDSELPLRLMHKLMLIINYIGMCQVTGVPISWLVFKGQQVKVTSLLYRWTLAEFYIIPYRPHSAGDDSDEVAYEGATVIEPKKGFYKNPTITLDFNSLYPSIMIAHNLCYTTYLNPNNLPKDSSTYTKTPNGNYFLKAHIKEGLLPRILKMLLGARADTRKQQKNEKDEDIWNVLEGLQKAYKITGNCFPAEDHEVLTSKGFMGLEAIQDHFKKNETLKVGCFVNGQLEYHSITINELTVSTGTHNLVCFDSKISEGSNSVSNGVSLRVTDNHRMYLRVGKTQSNRTWTAVHGKKQEQVAPPFQICTAGSVLEAGKSDETTVAQFTAVFPEGVANNGDLIFPQYLNLTTEDQIDAFIELYGYWLGDGWLDSSRKAIVFSPCKTADSAYLRDLFNRIGLTILSDDERGPGADGAYIAPEPDEIIQRKHYTSWKKPHVHLIYKSVWWQYFAEQYGHKYVGDATEMSINAAKRRGQAIPIPKYVPVKELSPETLLAATPKTGKRPVSFTKDHNRCVDGVQQRICYGDYCTLAGQWRPMTDFSSRYRNSRLVYEGKCKKCMCANTSKHHAAKRRKLNEEILIIKKEAESSATSSSNTAFDQPLDFEDVRSAKWCWWWVFKRLCKRRLRLFLKGCRMADGDMASGDRVGGQIFTASKRFAEELIRVATHAGYTALLRPRQKKGQSCGFNAKGVEIIARHQQWVVNYSDFTREAKPKITVATEMHTESYTGTVWCVTVPVEPHLIMVRQVIEKDGIKLPRRAVVIGNSIYGFTGALKGSLPLLAISASVTAFGRDMLYKAREIAEDKTLDVYISNSNVTYGDTDSIFINVDDMDKNILIPKAKVLAKHISTHFLHPINLDFEKLLHPMLLTDKKKRYCGLYWTKPDKWDKIHVAGFANVRRDGCMLIKDVMDKLIETMLLQGSVDPAINYIKQVISNIYYNKIDYSKLVISKALSKFDYTATLPHVELAKKKRKRDPSTAPEIGDRVPYIICRGNKGDSASERAEDPIYMIENGQFPDEEYYLNNQLRNPLTSIFEAFLSEQEIGKMFLGLNEFSRNNSQKVTSIFAGDHTLKRVKNLPKKNVGLLGYAFTRLSKCLQCNCPLTKAGNTLCDECSVLDLEDIIREQQQKVDIASSAHQECRTTCFTTCGSYDTLNTCRSQECHNFYKRFIAKDEYVKQQTKMDDLMRQSTRPSACSVVVSSTTAPIQIEMGE